MSKMITLLKDYFKDLVEGYKTPLDMDNWSKFYKKHWKGTAVSCIVAAIGGFIAGVSIIMRKQVIKTNAEMYDNFYREIFGIERPKEIETNCSMKEGRRHEA